MLRVKDDLFSSDYSACSGHDDRKQCLRRFQINLYAIFDIIYFPYVLTYQSLKFGDGSSSKYSIFSYQQYEIRFLKSVINRHLFTSSMPLLIDIN